MTPATTTNTKPARYEAPTLSLAQVGQMTGYDAVQIALIRHNMAASMNRPVEAVPVYDIALFTHACKTLDLDPLLKQAHWITRGGKGVLQVGIDGYRAIADRTRVYAGSSEPVFRGHIEWTWPDAPQGSKPIVVPEYCQVTTWKMVDHQPRPFVGEVRWREFVPDAYRESFQWRRMPNHMLAIRAESHSLRKAFPAQLGQIELAPEDGAEEVIIEAPARTATYAQVFENEDQIQARSDAQTRRAGNEEADDRPAADQPDL